MTFTLPLCEISGWGFWSSSTFYLFWNELTFDNFIPFWREVDRILCAVLHFYDLVYLCGKNDQLEVDSSVKPLALFSAFNYYITLP